MNAFKYFFLMLILSVLMSFSSPAQTLFRSGTFLHHSTGLNIWGPNGSATSIPQEMTNYNTVHGYSGSNAVTMGQQWWPSGGNNEWEYWHRIFDNEVSGLNIFSVMNNNKIVVIKSCFPSSEMTGVGQPSDTLSPTIKSIYNYKWHWRNIIGVMASRPQNFFAIWTNAPHVQGNTNPTAASLAKKFTTWAKDTLAQGLDPEMGALPPNIYVFHYFSKLTDANGYELPQYAISSSDSHPNGTATALIAPQFVNEIFDAAIAYEQSFSTLNVSPSSQSVNASAGTVGFTVSSVTAWTAQSNAGWCTVTPSGTGNGTLTATYSANTGTSSRTATITVSATGASNQTVTVVQAGSAVTLSVAPSSQNAPATAGSAAFTVTSNTSWTAQSNAGWCTVTSSGTGNGTLTATYSANTGTSSRTATITVSATGAANQTVTVVQAGSAATLSVAPSSQNAPATAGSAAFTVTSNTSWTAQSNAGWCTVTPSGTGNGTLTATYSANTGTSSRTATITVSASGAANQTVTVVQAGSAVTLSVAPSSQNAPATAGSAAFTVTSNTSWTAQSNAGWCTVTPSGTGNGTLTATYTANSGTTSRTATITVSASGTGNQTVTVVQAGTAVILTVTPSNQDVPATSGNTFFTVTSNSGWIAQSNAGWCVVTPSGTGNGTITASYTENISTASRMALITVSAAGASDMTVSVTQAGAAVTLSVTPSSQNVSSAAGSAGYSVASNTNWTAQSNAGWCTVTPSGTGNGTIIATYIENTGTTSRTATITVSATGVGNQTVTLMQLGSDPAMAVTPSNQDVGAAAGSTSYTVTSNVSWTAQSNAGWCTVTSSGTGNGELIADFTQNTNNSARMATITLSAPGTTDLSVTLTQAGAAIILQISPSNQNVSSNAGTTHFSVTSNSAWTAQSDAGWCTVTPSGSGNGTIIATYSENTITTSRTANITVSSEGVADQIVTVYQFGAAPVLQVSPPGQQVPPESGSVNFAVTSNTGWTVHSDAAWCMATPSGSGNGTITAAYLENHSTEDRVANLKVTAGGMSPVFITVLQTGLVTGVQQPELAGIRIYPNPTDGLIYLDIENTGNENLLVTISDASGRLVYNSASRGRISEEIDLKGYGKGLFNVVVSLGKAVSVRRILVR
ncbi:MAG: T9SS type A sorting domain-containing protein [Bacteroidales bacterium]|nr:T9SS type A sorting domain-containing protein [Bacteroidales bacterium]